MRLATRLSAFYAAIFLVTGIQLPFWPVWLASRGLTAREIGVLLAAAIWAKVIATPLIGALADKTGGRRMLMGALAAVALAAYAGLLPAGGLRLLIWLNLVALTAQSALMPLGDTITLAAARARGLDYGRIRLWGSVSFILASIASGTALASSSGERVLPLVLGASVLVLLACLYIPTIRPVEGAARIAGIRAVAGDRSSRFLSLPRRLCRRATKFIMVSERSTGARWVSRTRRSAGFGRKESSPKSCSSGRAGGCSPGSGRSD